MKNSIASLVIVSLLILSTANAKQNYWHDYDRYVVEMDGEGDATVLAYISLENIGTETIYSVTLEVPNERSMIHYIAQEGYYSYDIYPRTSGGLKIIDSYSIQRFSDSVIIDIDLPNPLEQNGRRSLLVVYTTPDVAKKDLIERFHVNFKTIKDSSSFIRDVSVSITPPPGYYMKGVEGEVAYKPSFVLSSLKAGNMEAAAPALDYIRYSEGENFKNLDPGESAVVTGIYSEHWWVLYYLEIFGTLVIGFVLFFAIHVYAKGGKR